ncbi:MAG: 5'-3' exonuclease H3TH domain-containing protein [Actinomycetota bacterium]|jgi:5'-3' exonuclease|nr:flap endonuclease [Acidimicrobiaceae bacterium]MEC7915305.1 5'-3' exonuclease H3TH domain-containing protein [Actinomycetota bacterium]MEC9058149.1 5'-3' exonuclease H3TH domain-containing protein [Actinomycetota bacterium]
MSFEVHLIDGTYELFRHFFAVPSRKTPNGAEVGAIRGVLNSVISLLEAGATHIAVATDSTITSFRNELWPDYKDGSDLDPLIGEQFQPLEEGLRALGIEVWPMVEFEADDALAAGSAMANDDPRVTKVLICTPDKDLAQCVGGKVFQWDRRKDLVLGSHEVREKYGVTPASIPDYLALVGDAADGFPGLSGWGQKSSATVLSYYGSIEMIPDEVAEWEVEVRAARTLAATLASQRSQAMLFKEIATVRTDAPVAATVDALEWSAPTSDFERFCSESGLDALLSRTQKMITDRT